MTCQRFESKYKTDTHIDPSSLTERARIGSWFSMPAMSCRWSRCLFARGQPDALEHEQQFLNTIMQCNTIVLFISLNRSAQQSDHACFSANHSHLRITKHHSILNNNNSNNNSNNNNNNNNNIKRNKHSMHCLRKSHSIFTHLLFFHLSFHSAPPSDLVHPDCSSWISYSPFLPSVTENSMNIFR